MKIGIFGGSFNPPHNMHKKIALELIEKKYVDKVIYVPTGDKYNKDGLIKAIDRYEMVKLMCKDSANLLVSNYEMDKDLVYTYESLLHFKNKYKNDEIYFICGSDNLLDFTTWNNYQYILDTYKILVINRGDDIKSIEEKYQNIIITDIALSNLSSTEVRKLIDENSFDKLKTKVDVNVLEYIKKKNLYK